MCWSSKTGVRDKMRIPQQGKRTCRDLHTANYPQLRVVSAHDSHGHRRRIGFPQFGSLSAGSWRGAPTRPAFKSLRGQVRGSTFHLSETAAGARSSGPGKWRQGAAPRLSGRLCFLGLQSPLAKKCRRTSWDFQLALWRSSKVCERRDFYRVTLTWRGFRI